MPKPLPSLYRPPSSHHFQCGDITRGILAVYRLVCLCWSKIVKSIREEFIIRAYDKEWLSPSFPYYILRHTPALPQDERDRNQESNPGLLSEDYRTALVNSHPKFLPELIPNIVTELYGRLNEDGNWVDERRSVIQTTLAAFCLVSREWNRTSTPIMYGDIFLGGKNPLITRSLLYRTLRHSPAHKALVKTVMIEPAEDGSTANLLSICFSMPNLRKLTLDLRKFDLSALHPSFVQQLRRLSKCCTIQMVEDRNGLFDANWDSLSSCIDFTRRSKSTSCSFALCSDVLAPAFHSNIYFYIGEHEALVLMVGGHSDIGKYEQYLARMGQHLKGLFVQFRKDVLLPGKHVLSLRLVLFSHRFFRNQPPRQPLPSISTVPHEFRRS